MEDREHANSQGKTRRRSPPWTGALLSGSERLAAIVDGAGKRPAARRATDRALPSVPRTFGGLESIAEDNPESRRQHVGAGRGVHPRSQLRSSSEEKASGAGATEDDRIRRTAPVPRRGGRAALVRHYLPQVQAVPQ